MVKNIAIVIVLLILSYWTVSPFFEKGFFPMHDDTQAGRVVAMGMALKNGQFPVRWVSDLGYGYGYPLFNFYAPLPYYVGGFLYVLGMSGLAATKLMFLIGMVLPALTLFFVLWRTFGFSISLLASLLYIYAPYHAVQAYVRGAVGEFWTLIFYPLLLYGLLKKSVLVGALGLAGVILSHTLLGYATVIFLSAGLIAFWLWQTINRRLNLLLIAFCLLSVLLGLSLSAFFWLPALTEMKYTNVASQVSATADFHDNFVCLPQLWDSVWGFGGSATGCIDGLSFKLGKLQIILAALSVFLVFIRRKVNKFFVFGLILTVLAIFLMLPVSTPIWEAIPGMAYLQYPWRFLAWAILGLSLMAAALINFFPKKVQWFFLLLIPVLIAASSKMFQAQYLVQRPVREYEAKNELRWRVSKVSDEYLPPSVPRPNREEDVPTVLVPNTDSSASITEAEKETYFRVRVAATNPTGINIASAYFPGWRYFLNGRKIEPKIEKGLPQLSVPAGENIVEAKFTNTPVRTLGNLISLGTIVVLILWRPNQRLLS